MDLIPGDEECTGVTLDGATLGAYTLAELTAVINGEAFLYTGYGWIASAFQNYQVDVGGKASLTLSLFNQATPANAEALYNDPQSGSGDPVTGWSGNGDARMTSAFGVTTLQFWEECLFGKVLVMAQGQAAVDAVRCLAEKVVTDIQGQTPLDVETWTAIKAMYR
ncbi:MAG: hypothetical protein KAW17_06885 [Candidatus Eisenbacteria sp.]|nr:hypothetical protein [Candidatus Eisenbacteria bacterium]